VGLVDARLVARVGAELQLAELAAGVGAGEGLAEAEQRLARGHRQDHSRQDRAVDRAGVELEGGVGRAGLGRDPQAGAVVEDQPAVGGDPGGAGGGAPGQRVGAVGDRVVVAGGVDGRDGGDLDEGPLGVGAAPRGRDRQGQRRGGDRERPRGHGRRRRSELGPVVAAGGGQGQGGDDRGSTHGGSVAEAPRPGAISPPPAA
jgi:hypothetical protein